MSDKISRRSVLCGLAGFVAVPGFAGAPKTSVRPALRGPEHFKLSIPKPDSIIARANLGGRVCFAVADVQSGEILEGANARTGIPPASVTKAITALYALDTLGAGHRFVTRVVATGGVQNGVVTGDLVLVGGADPTLSTDGLAALVRSLKDSGVREVRGAFKVAEGALPFVPAIDPGQPDHVGYSPAVSGIALNFNRVHFEWRRQSGAYRVTMDARSERFRPDVYMARMQIADRAQPVFAYRDGGTRDEWSVARSALGGSGSRWLPVRKPALYAGDVFQTLARAEGIVLKTPQIVGPIPTGSVLASHQSAPLRDILRDMLRFSTNLTAEMVGLAATSRRVGKPSTLAGTARQMNKWAEAAFNIKGFALVDHSGLGDRSRMTPEAMVKALTAAHKSNTLRPILKAVAMRDARGRVLKQHPMRVDAKTGTLNFVSGLAGYATTSSGRELAFAIFAADEGRRAKIPRSQREAPEGAKGWNRRAKSMQQQLIERWDVIYAG